MARSSFFTIVNRMAREAAKAQRRAEADQRRRQREYAQSVRAQERTHALAAKEAKQRYLEERVQEADDQNTGVAQRLTDLRGILEQTLHVDDTIQFDALRSKEKFPAFLLPSTICSLVRPRLGFLFLPGSNRSTLSPASSRGQKNATSTT